MQSVTEVRGNEGEISPTFEELFGSGDVGKPSFEDLFGKGDVKSSRLKCPLKNGKEFKLPSGNHTFTSSTLTSAIHPSAQKRDRGHLENPKVCPNLFRWLWKNS